MNKFLACVCNKKEKEEKAAAAAAAAAAAPPKTTVLLSESAAQIYADKHVFIEGMKLQLAGLILISCASRFHEESSYLHRLCEFS